MNSNSNLNNWSCLPRAFANALNISFDNILKYLGHDGSEIIYPNLKDPYRRKGFHWQEFILPCHMNNYALVSVEAVPVIGEKFAVNLGEERMLYFLNRYKGVLVGEMPKLHAVVWDTSMAWDDDKTYDLHEISIREFLALIPI